MKPINECKTVYELLESPERWMKGAYSNREVIAQTDGVNDPDATCFCIQGAIRKIYTVRSDNNRYVTKVKNTLPLHHYEYLHEWNDAPERTHAEVLEAVRKAGI
jgi:hypothetical protein